VVRGFATWFAGSARRALGVSPRPDLYIDTDGSPGAGNLGFSYSFEAPNVPALGAANEVAVTACLWDTNDDSATLDGTPGADDDALAHPSADAWEVVRNYLPQAGVLRRVARGLLGRMVPPREQPRRPGRDAVRVRGARGPTHRTAASPTARSRRRSRSS
jgi:hypothetical protein